MACIQMMINIALDFDEVIASAKQNERDRKVDFVQHTIEAQKKEREKILKAAAELYPDWKNGEITREEYMSIKANLNEKIEKLDATIANLEKTQAYDSGEVKANGFVEHFMKYRNIDSLTRPMLVELIDKIIIHEGEKITIKLKCADVFESMLGYIDSQSEVA